MARIVLAALVLAVSLTGCAVNQKTMSRDEFISTTQHSYEGVTEREFYQAAERLFTLSDGDDTQFSYPDEHSMAVQRDWTIYLVVAFAQGSHNWEIKTEPKEGGLDASAYVSTSSNNVSGMVTGGGGAFTSTGPTMRNVVSTPAIYELFWARMDYLLDKSNEWPTCGDWESKIDSGETYGLVEPLCLAMNTDDLHPGEVQ